MVSFPLHIPMASFTPALASAPTVLAFNDTIPPPYPVVVLLGDSDIDSPQLVPLLMHTDIPRSTDALRLGVRAKTPRPGGRAATPRRAVEQKRSSKTPGLRATSSPLTSEDEGPPPPKAVERLTIPRPKGAQYGVESHLTLTNRVLTEIRVCVSSYSRLRKFKCLQKTLNKAATAKLDLTLSFKAQNGDAMKEYQDFVRRLFYFRRPPLT